MYNTCEKLVYIYIKKNSSRINNIFTIEYKIGLGRDKRFFPKFTINYALKDSCSVVFFNCCNLDDNECSHHAFFIIFFLNDRVHNISSVVSLIFFLPSLVSSTNFHIFLPNQNRELLIYPATQSEKCFRTKIGYLLR